MASFNTAAFPDSLALGKADSLLIGTIDEIQASAQVGCEANDCRQPITCCASKGGAPLHLIQLPVKHCLRSSAAEAAHPHGAAGGAAAAHRAPGHQPHVCGDVHASQHQPGR